MSNQITDTAGAPITVLSLSLVEDTESSLFVIRVPCAAGQFLVADASSSAAVLVRRTGSGDAFTDISVAPVDLAPDAGNTVSFDVKVSAGEAAGFTRVAIPVRVKYL